MGLQRGLSATEKYERQKLLARERQRKRRAKLNPEELEKKKEYDRKYYKKLKGEKKIKSISEMTQREARKKRNSWRKANKNRRERQQAIKAALNDTPPSSPSSNCASVPQSRQKIKGRKILKANRAKVYRTLKKKDDTIKQLETQLERYKKRFYREKQKNSLQTSPSPRKKVKELVGREKVSPNIQQRLFLGMVLEKQLEMGMKANAATKKKNQQHKKIIGNKLLKKYRVQTHFKKLVPYKANKVLAENVDPSQYTRKSTEGSISQKHSKQIVNFFECDTVSRMCPGKKDYVRKGSMRKQRRILLDTMENLHRRFVTQTKINMSLRNFYRNRPYWVTFPRKSDRDTCACVKHTNMEFLTTSLKRHNIIQEKNLTEIVDATVCSSKDERCMNGMCPECKNKMIAFHTKDDDSGLKIKYFKWENIKEKRVIKNKSVVISKTVKVKKIQKTHQVIKEFQMELANFKKHQHRAVHQSSELKEKKILLKQNELIFHLDFSENYVCKYSTEIQSAHFGASKVQISLNTGVFYYKSQNKLNKMSFASVSDNLDHQAHAVWAHMDPVFKKTARMCPNATTIHFFSDSPSSQYRNKTNIFLMKTRMSKYFKNMTKMTWNYTEAGHGKGPMDGVGGCLKREADRKVAYGADIKCAADFFEAMKDSTVSIFEIKSSSIQKIKEEVCRMKIPPINGIMKTYQVTYSGGVMTARRLSCFECPPSQHCDDFFLFEIFPDDIDDSEEIEISFTTKTNGKRLFVDEVFDPSDDEMANPLPSSPTPGASEMYDKGQQEELPCTRRTKQVFWKDVLPGSYVLVQFPAVNKNVNYTYLCVVQKKDDDDGEITVQGLKLNNKKGNEFVSEDNDVSVVQIEQIIEILEEPQVILKNRVLLYKFPHTVDVFEK